MESPESRPSPAIADEAPQASLQLELRVPERQMVAAFRDAFLRWLNDRAGPFAGLGGRAEGLALDEVPEDGESPNRTLLRLSVRWSFSPRPAARVPIALPPPTALPMATRQNLPAVDHFVFFPDPPETATPMLQAVSIPLQRDEVPPRHFHLARSASTRLAHMAGRRVGAAVRLAQAAPGRFGLSGLTVRTPFAPSGPRVWGAWLFGAAAVAVGFTAGSIYLATSTRPAHNPELPAAAATTARSEPVASPLATIPLSPTPPGESLPQVDGPGHPMDLVVGSVPRQPLPPTSSALGIADAEVTTRRGPAAPVPVPAAAAGRPVADGHATPVVVRAAEVTGTAGADLGKVRGALLVKSEPQGAEVSINGVVHGRTPLVIRDLGAGSRVVRLDLAGYERWSWAIAVVANRRTPVTVKLQPELRGASQE